ncbi:hypothetical protein ABZ883_34455 [Streptomyces sp. NPDC046977]|uniref:hypothetical protein n=1 Tax=Streptomyces sp. NPDC046977 TaxID=3154703 RepID=UPI00340D9E16
MEFTVERTLRKRGSWWVGWGLALLAGSLLWLVASGSPEPGQGLFAALSVPVAGYGWSQLRRARQPFRLRIDAFGITLHDAVLPWGQISAVSLWYEQPADSDTTPPKPRLRLWTAPGVTLPRKPDRGRDALDRYTLLNCADLDQHVGHLRDALAQYAGDRFETAPRAVRPPIPVTVAGPELSVPGGERTFTADLGDGRRTRVWTMWALLFSAVFVSVYVLVIVFHNRLGSDSAIGIPVTVSMLGTLICWIQVRQSYVRWRKPMELRIDATGIAMREVANPGNFFRWSDISTVTVGRPPYSLDPRPCLTVWALPGAHDSDHARHLIGGHRGYVLDRIDRLPGGAEAVIPVLRAYAGERYAETA